jgi:hypothetical protein
MPIHKANAGSTIVPTKQRITFNSPHNYFAGFLQAVIDQSGIEATVQKEGTAIALVFDNDDPSVLTRFNENIARYLPYSIFLGDIETTAVEEIKTVPPFRSEPYQIAPCPKCLEQISDPSSPFYLDASLSCNHYSNDKTTSIEHDAVYSPHYGEGNTALVTDTNKLQDLFLLTDHEIKLLLSIEKPTITATINDETLQQITGKRFIAIKAPYNTKSVLSAINAKESGIDYLFFEETHDLKMVVAGDNQAIIRANRIATKLQPLHKDKQINRCLNIMKEAGFDEAIGAYLSRDGIAFFLSDKKIIQFEPFDLDKTLARLEDKKIMQNFMESYPDVVKELKNGNKDLFATIATLLELEIKDFEALSSKSNEFQGNGGVKIDTNFKEGAFDYRAFLNSIISFKLAGTPQHLLAYSVFEALGDMAITVMLQLKEKFGVKNFVMMGDLFENSVLYSRIINKFQLHNPYFSRSFALDD